MKSNTSSIPPNYLRAVNFQNKTGIDAEIDVTFDSGTKTTFTAKQSSDLNV
jgi:hypothetical protein